uniref:Uncharacterized protein n=1 Tax=Anguilla anguilla TaxID=7936 RepID=A0A0E9QIS2_ANGAN
MLSQAFLVVFVVKVFIFKLLPINALSSSAILTGEIPSLDHKLLYNPVEWTSFEVLAAFLLWHPPLFRRCTRP